MSDWLTRNPVFSGGAGLAVVGLAAAAGRELLRTALRLTRKHLTVSLEIPSKDRSYQWVLQWLSKQQPQASAAHATSSLPPLLVRWAASLTRQQHLGVETSFSQSASGVISTHFDFVPSPGEHAFWYKHRLIHYTRTREKSMVDLQTGSPWETVTLRTFGRSQALMLELLTEAKTAALRKTENRTIIFTSSGIDWRPFGQPRKKRPMDSVVLDRGVGEGVVDDFRSFLSSQQWYVDRGIPYRRGYLLYGPPGCGKCFARGTLLRLLSGLTVAVEDVVGGEQLMGDDGLPRTITPGSLTQGVAPLYRISPTWDGARPFTVNGAHILVLINRDKPRVSERSDGGWGVVEWQLTTDNRMIHIERGRTFRTQALAEAELDAVLQAGWEPLMWEPSVEDFLTAPATVRHRCQLVACRAITFTNPLLPSLLRALTQLLGVPPSTAQLDYMAWWLGMWLSQGASTSPSISQGEERPFDSHQLQHRHISARLLAYQQLFHERVDQVDDRRSSAGHSICWFHYGIDSVAGRVLRCYDLLGNQHVPQALLCDSLAERQRLLAGLIDGCGSYDIPNHRYEMRSDHLNVITGCKELAATLGLRNSVIAVHTRTSQHSDEVYSGHRMCISGSMWDVVRHCAATCKRCPTAECVEEALGYPCYGFSIERLPAGDYFGFAVHGGANRRFLLDDYTVTHNSSFIQALSGALQYNICVLNLNDRALTDDKLAYLLSTLPPRSLLLLEDVDAAFQQRDQRSAAVSLTFSGLLNALDGVASTEERVIFMTTNHIERLDPALIRPGRVDVRLYIGMASEWQRSEMWRRFYEGEEGWRELGDRFVEQMAEVELSVAELQGFFLLHKANPRAALQASGEWKRSKVDDSRRRALAEREQRRAAAAAAAAAATTAEPPTRTFQPAPLPMDVTTATSTSQQL